MNETLINEIKISDVFDEAMVLEREIRMLLDESEEIFILKEKLTDFKLKYPEHYKKLSDAIYNEIMKYIMV